jgi:hypothetical protein
MGALNPSPRAPAQIVSAELGQHQVEDDEVRVFAHRPVTGLAVHCCQDLVRLELEVIPQTAKDGGVVFIGRPTIIRPK